ncbi:hypothetical protein ACFLZT_04300 [Thermodesulfobacteriota bacterium]
MTRSNKPVFSLSIFLMIFGILFSCTVLPIREFNVYKETFDKVRLAGEEILLDYGSVSTQIYALEQQVAENEKITVEKVNAQRELTFDIAKKAAETVDTDHILVRMRAWAIIALYNEVLTGLAEGKSASEVAGTIDSLMNNLTGFPAAEITDIAADIVPYVGALKALLETAQLEWSRQKFIHVVLEGGPSIQTKFIAFLRDDLQNIYNVRAALNDLSYQQTLDDIAALATDFHKLANKYKNNPEIDKLVKLTDQVNHLLKSTPDYLSGDEETDSELLASLEGEGKEPYSDLAHSQLVQFKNEIMAKLSEAQQLNSALGAYQNTMLNYRKLIDEMARSLRNLETNIIDAKPQAPPAKELQSLYIIMRQSYETFKATRR